MSALSLEQPLTRENQGSARPWLQSSVTGRCPRETANHCDKVNNLPCDPGMKGCVLHGRFVSANDDKNARLGQKRTCKEEINHGEKPIAGNG